MPALFIALITAFLAAFGGRDQRLMASLSSSHGASGSLLGAAWAASIVTAGLAALAGSMLATLLPPAGKAMLVAIALLLAAAELAWPIKLREPKEPTHSLFAILLVIFSRQVTDAARFLIVAVAAATGAPVLAAIGGAIGGGAALTLGWAAGSDLTQRFPLRAVRLVVAGLLLLAAVWTGLAARGII